MFSNSPVQGTGHSVNLTAFPSGGLGGGCSPARCGLGRSAMSSLMEPAEYIYLDAKLS